MKNPQHPSVVTLFLVTFTMLLFVGCASDGEQSPEKQITGMYLKSDLTPPDAAQKPKELTTHGDTRIDNYYWLNQREDQEVLDYLNAENDYTKEMTSHLESFQDELFDEIVGRIKQDDASVPYRDNGFWYYTRYEEGKEYPIYARKPGTMDNEEEVMLNVNELAKDYAFYQVGSRSISPNNEILAFGEDTLSRRIYNIRFKNLKTGEMLEDYIPNTGGGAVWANDNKTLFYAVKDEALRSYKIFRHTLGTPATDDVEVFHEADETFSAYVGKTKSKEYIIIASFQTVSTEYRYLDANDPNGSFKVVQPRERDLEYSLSHYGDHWYIRCNLDARNFRLMRTPVTATTKDNWEEVIPHREDVLLEGVDIFKDYLVVSERIKGITQLRVRPWDGSEEHYLDFGEDAFSAYTSVNPEFDTDQLRVSYTSLTTPSSVMDYNMKDKTFKLLKEQEVVGSFDKTNYRSERIFVKARDGVEVPVSIVYHKNTEINGEAPCLLYGYGSYGYSMDPYFSSVRLSLLDRGFVYAIAHIRGGEEMGRHWYEDGKLLNKKNTFTDFIDCGQYLIENSYSSEEKLFAMGGSAGGLLMGAISNMAPDLWAGIVSAVPFVDVVTTMLDESIPLTTGEYDEWGNPNDPTYYEYIKSYSPYDNLEAKDYPPMLVTTGLHDSQVQYWEPAKYVAKLRDLKTDKNPLLLHTNMDAGHSGKSGRFQRYRETALEYAFMLDLAGKAPMAN